jgi:hypothetical protein
VRRGWEHLTTKERALVQHRVETVLAHHVWGPHAKDSLLHFFTFLAQVETIAIEIPLRFLPHAPKKVQPLLRRQLVDEVFHSTIFARLAHELAVPNTQPPPPLPSAERLLDKIRNEPDLAVTACLLNLVAEGWIETLFKHALRWGISDPVFKAVLADEARHVDEASQYLEGLDLAKAQAAVEEFEQGMMAVGAEPSVALAILDLAGEANQRALAMALQQQHRTHLAEVGLHPSKGWDEAASAASRAVESAEPVAMPAAVEDTEWRRLARRVWVTPRDPTMVGDFDVPVGHVPRKALTPVIIAALGRAWAKHPPLNRIVARDRVWQLPQANVGVRVLLDDDELATVIIPEADRRSVNDIRRMLQDGIAQLKRARRESAKSQAPPTEIDPTLAGMMPALPHMFAVAISNAGKWGVVSGSGSFSGWVSPSTDITVGLRRRLPRWKGIAYFPSWHVNVAAIQDHRVFDGRASALTVTGIQEALSPKAVKEILQTPDTLPPEDPDNPSIWERDVPPAQDGQLAMLAFLGLPKYTPVALGGLGLGVLAGVGGYLLYQTLNTPIAAAAGAAAGGAGGATQAAAPGAVSAGAGGTSQASAAGTPDATRGAKGGTAASAPQMPPSEGGGPATKTPAKGGKGR